MTSGYAIADTPPPAAKEQTAAPATDATPAEVTPPAETEAPAPAAVEVPAPAAPVPVAAEAPASGEASTTAPSMVSIDKISAGDTAWMLSSTALVLLMTIPGLALFYGGMVRKRNVLSTVFQSFAVCCIVTVLWVVIGYSLAFTPGSLYVGSLDRLLLHGLAYVKSTGQLTVSHIAPTIPESVFVMFQMTFAIITPALITGAFAERIKFSAMVIFMSFWTVLIYAPIAHWVWEPGGLLASQGVLDFAGGTVVHINAGIAGLMCAYVLGPRRGYGKEPFPPYNLVYTMIGASLLWVGWFGFNAGSAVASDGRAGMAMLVTQVATATAVLTWMMIEWVRKSRVTLLGACSGAVAGLVAITPASGFVDTEGALIIGVAAGLFCYWGATALKRLLGADDALDVFGIHGVGGAVGALLTGVLASKSICDCEGSVISQSIGVLVTLTYSGIGSLIILKIIDWTIGLRVNPEDEQDGLDISQHAERLA
ncbi:MAG TPA: ammonium transporter [Methyloradius sp.]